MRPWPKHTPSKCNRDHNPRSSFRREPLSMRRPCSKCSRQKYAMCKCQYNEQATRGLRRWTGRKTAASTACSRHSHRRLPSKYSDHRHTKRTDRDLSNGQRMRRYRTRASTERHCSSRPPLNSACLPYRRRPPASTEAPPYSPRHRSQKCTLRSLLHGRHHTSSPPRNMRIPR
jgi:hypothetical protein